MSLFQSFRGGNFFRQRLATVVILSGFASIAFGQDKETRFAEANQRFSQGDFPGAVSAYSKLAEEGLVSPELYFNLGTSHFRLGQSGEAALWMRRALVVDPDMVEPRQSLAFLRSKYAFLEFAETQWQSFLRRCFPNPATWIVSICIWTFLLLFVSRFVFPAVAKRRALCVMLLSLTGVTAGLGLRAERYYKKNLAIHNFATVTGSNSSARTAPTPESKAVIDLPVGSEVRILQQTGSWTYIDIPGDVRGWIRIDSLQPIWPENPTFLSQSQ